MNDTTRQVGGALGVAVLGSVLSSGYQSAIGGALLSLPPAVAELARSSIGAAAVLASQVGGATGQQLSGGGALGLRRGHGDDRTGRALVMVAAALLALLLRPARAPEERRVSLGHAVATGPS